MYNLKYLKNSFNTLGIRVLGVVILFGLTLYLTRNFEPREVGNYDFARTLLLLVSSFSVLGIDQSILYFTGLLNANNSLDNIKDLYIKNITVIVISSLLALILFAFIPKVFIDRFFNDMTSYHIIQRCIYILFFYSITIFNTEYIRALGMINLSELFRNTFKYFPLIFGAIYLVNFNSIYDLVDCYYYGFVLLSIITTMICLIKNKNFEVDSQKYLINRLDVFKYSLPISLGSICVFLTLSIDVFLLKKYYSSELVAYYSTAMKLMNILTMVILSFNINISIKISELFRKAEISTLKDLIIKNTRIVFVINFILAVFLILFGKYILTFFGKSYISSFNSMVILLIAQLYCSLFSTAPIILIMIGKSRVYLYLLLISTFVNGLANVILIPEFGIQGASIGFLLTSVFTYTSIYLYVRLKHQISIFIL